ncbi:Mo-dependent nitrogenase C-terminal domain-containing protein [Gloeocapsa sp. PCC 73106]|uniref:Mo-dependent nitrogenase C-terminal domain-containing protein n=1 Tax=Gloeocapsa sp. PCC 73106 TaxID=102232 RepID=UPI0002ACC8E4|nr:Mo-dependent nitrogenase C-terminal domain-containing protein [Gloeocapsa sp. PCC 73106]ELR96446.1 tellurite resistance protein [Gloeocapsa sp. PCC 73106]
MVNANESMLSDNQMIAWLRGLLTIALADGHYDPEEQALVAKITQELTLPNQTTIEFESISASELASQLGENKRIAENFLKTAVLVALADGVYSTEEAKILHEYREALGLEIEVLKSLEVTLYQSDQAQTEIPPDLLQPVKTWLDGVDIEDPRLARFLCKLIPAQCPFERDIVLFNRKIVHIPPMCKLNPLYEQLVGLRFRALSYLADERQEDVSDYL